MTQPKIGFIGLGLMGAAMVGRLQDKGYHVTVTANRSRPNIDAAVARGATEVGTAREVAEASDITMLCMGTSDQVESRMRGPDGLIAGMSAGDVAIDFGTSLPASTRTLGKEVEAAGGQYLDSPIGRTPAHAVDGLLNLMCSGDKATFDRVKPVLDDLGENVFHLGDLGAGHTIKLFNNFLAMSTANIMSEIFAMADLSGVPRQSVYDVMAAGPLHSMMMDFVKAYAIDGDPQNLAFAIKNGMKDVGYYDQMAKDAGAESFIAKAPLEAMQKANADGRGDDLVPMMYDFYRAQFGVK